MPIKLCVTPKEAVDFLNGLLKIDPAAMTRLVFKKTGCNQALTDHPTVQVSDGKGFDSVDMEAAGYVGLLGIINGMFGVIETGPKKGFGPITAEIDDEIGMVTGFRLTEE